MLRLQGGELTDQFLRLMLEAAVVYYNVHEPAPGAARLPGSQQLSYLAADAFTRLMCILISGARPIHHTNLPAYPSSLPCQQF